MQLYLSTSCQHDNLTPRLKYTQRCRTIVIISLFAYLVKKKFGRLVKLLPHFVCISTNIAIPITTIHDLCAREQLCYMLLSILFATWLVKITRKKRYLNQIIHLTKTLETPFSLLKFHNHHDTLQAKTTIVKMPQGTFGNNRMTA